MNFKLFLSPIILLNLLIFSSCTEKVDIDLDNIDPEIVVEGLVSNDADKTPFVKLSLSTDYFKNEVPPAISDALVIITEDDLLIDTLKEIEPGYYEAQKILQGKIDTKYQLFIKTKEGEIYEATDWMYPVANLDSLSVNYREETAFSYKEDGYYITINFQEPAETDDFYRLFFYLNGEQYDPEELTFASDILGNGQYIRNIEFSEFVVFPDDTISVEMHSMSERYYHFISDLDANRNSGDLFDTPPANVKGNISNGAYGFFAASAISKKGLIIQE